jgi:putative endonuclease
MGGSAKVAVGSGQGAASERKRQVTTKGLGDQAEALAREHLQRSGLRCLQANFHTPGRGGGEIDLIMCEPDGTLVFVEVRQRSRGDFGGAAASISRTKQARIILAARHYLMRLRSLPPCRFDVVLVEGDLGRQAQITWLKAAFDAG